MTPAPPNNPGHQEAQGRPSETTTQPPPWENADDSLSAEAVLNALDALLKTAEPVIHLIIRPDETNDIQVLLYKSGKPFYEATANTVHEALKHIVE